jgi:DNA-binding GntR family transcriptional regulator
MDGTPARPPQRTLAKPELPRIHRPTTVKEQVYRTLRDQLTSGRAAPNERVIESEVTKQLGVSRTPVREALTRLAGEGFLVATHYGYRVPDVSADDILNLSEIRLLLEPTAARQAAERATKAQLDEMKRIIAEEKAAHASGDVNAFLRAHHRYRSTWLGCARNPLLIEALRRTLHSLSLVRLRTMNDSELRIFIIGTHESLLTALAARNPERAARVQAEIIEEFKKLLLTRIVADQPGMSEAGNGGHREKPSGASIVE